MICHFTSSTPSNSFINSQFSLSIHHFLFYLTLRLPPSLSLPTYTLLTPFHKQLSLLITFQTQTLLPTLASLATKVNIADAVKRDLETEGFYTGDIPPVSQRNINIIENRIVRDKVSIYPRCYKGR